MIPVLSAEAVIGFLGAGQLARMSAYAAYRMGFRVAVYSGVEREINVPGSEPLEQLAPLQFTGSFDDETSLLNFMSACDVVTLENEFLDGSLLHKIESLSKTPIFPSPDSFLLLETKWLEKETFRKAGIPVTPYEKITSIDELNSFALNNGYPFVLKSSKGGYDGYGNKTIRSADDHAEAFSSLGGASGHELIAEAFIPFEKELAVQVARNRTGAVVYPCCETIQENHICKTVIAPARVDLSIQKKACELALAATEAIDGTGLFAYEFFLTKDGALLLNESAPRPHNSGHYTIEGCACSQFENHIRTVAGLPLGSTEMRAPVAVMENLLGTHNRPAQV
ncbi:5-(carboxyamino)imidazole ribonucleotide synthase, partial [Balneolaceae bacterium ANBcel3]|nr:5-(carboxyamino)imidazole ribonucleotide synthase [Balneolaceae bacterium ANBcel3]